MNAINKIVKESSINFTGSILGNILGYVWLMLMTRTLSQEDFGTFTLAQSIINIFLIIVLFGTHKSLDRFIPVFRTAGDFGRIKYLLRSVLVFMLITSSVVVIIVYFTSDFLSINIFDNLTLARLLPIITLSVPMLSVILIVTYAFGGYKELRYHVLLKQILEPVLKILFALLLAFLGLGIVEWTWFYLITLFITSIVALRLLAIKIFIPLVKVNSEKIDFREIISYSWPISIASVLVIVIGQIDYLILGIYHPAANIGIYRIYIQIVVLLKLILGSIARIYKPVISELIPQNKNGEIRNTYQRVSKWILALTTLGLIVIVLFGDRLTSILFTDDYSVFPLALTLLALGTYLNSAFGPEGTTLEAFGNTKLLLVNSLISLAVNIGLGFLLIPNYGIVGAAIATGATLTLGGLLGFLEINIMYKMQPFSLNTLKFIFVGSITGIVFFGLDRLFYIDNFILLSLMIALMALFYFTGLIITQSIDNIDKEIVGKIIGRFKIIT